MHVMLDDQYPTMPWDAIDAVVFDVGNVLLTYDPRQLLEKYVPDQPELWPALMKRVFHSPYWAMLDRGLMDSEAAIPVMIGNHPELTEAVTAIMRGWVNLDDVIDEGLKTLKKCKAMGKKLYVLSNYNDKAFALARKNHAFFSHFDDFLISGEVGMIKPDPAIYRLLIERFRLTPERTVFIDDSYVNIEGALYAGLQGVCYNHPGKLREFFEIL